MLTPRFLQIVDDLFYIGSEIFIFGSPDDEVALSVYAKIIGSPIIDAVGFDCLIDYCAQFMLQW